MKKIFKVFKKSSSSSSSSSSSDTESEQEKPLEEKPEESPSTKSWSITHSDIEIRRPNEKPKRQRPKSSKPAIQNGNISSSSNNTIQSASEDDKRKRPVSRQSRPKHHITAKRNESVSSYPEERVKVESIPPWEMLCTANAKPPRALTVTSTKQNNELQAVLGLEAAHAEGQSSTEWLTRHSVDASSLSIDEILKCGIRIKPPDGEPDTAYIKYDAAKLQDFEFKINEVIKLCQERINWLLKGSRRSFGMVKGSRVALLVDASDANCGYGRLELFQESLLGLINEQLVNKEMLYMVSFGTKVKPLWAVVRDVNFRIIDEATWWVNTLRPSGGCNLLGALKTVLKRREIDSIVLVLGNTPDQNPKVICDYVRESIAGRKVPLHTVAYDCTVSETNIFLRELATQTNGRYHCYASTSDDQIMSGTDLSLLVKEMNKAKEVLMKIHELRGGAQIQHKESARRRSVESLALATMPFETDESIVLGSQFTDSSPLVVEHPSFPARTSGDWLRQHGLKAKGLNLYQVLAPNAYSYVNGYISSINRKVQSKVHEMSMAQFRWHDGTIKNVHVDPTLLFDYQRHLEAAVHLYKRRVEWLSVGGRKIFGTVVEKRVVIIVDMSICMSPAVLRLQEHMRILLEQQMANKTSYNVICFGDKVEVFRPSMVEPSPEYLEATWKWFLQRGCKGSRNFLDAFRYAVENEEELKKGIEVEGIYLITSGVPDEPKEVVCGFVSEALAGRNSTLHTIFYEVDDEDGLVAIPGRFSDRDDTASVLKDMAHVVHGRFHWFRNGDIIESDDLKAVLNEMDKSFNYSQKTTMLLDTVRRRKIQTDDFGDDNQLVPRPPSATKTKMALTPPRHTALTKARMNTRPQTAHTSHSSSSNTKARPRSASSQTKESTLKALCWKPPTANTSTSLIPVPPPPKNYIVKERRPSLVKSSTQTFYTENKNETGAVFTQYPTSTTKKPRRPITHPYIPDKEEAVTTREWMRHYSLSKLKLDLNNIVGTAECSHAKSKVQTLGQSVPARYCTIFPTVEVKGVVKHLHLLPHELRDYEEQVEKVMKRYVKRMQWLMSGSRRVFGTIVEKKVTVLIDTSGSMVTSMDELKRELAALIWDQIRNKATKFNLIRFSTEAVPWKPTLVDTNDDTCQEAVEWVTGFEASGSTCTLDALQKAFGDIDVEGIYLLTDGKPDHSTTMVLRELAKLNSSRNVKIHCTSFNCDDSAANKFLQLLASQTGGRFNRCQGDNDGHVFAHRLLTEGIRDDEPMSMPVFEGDDLRRLASEIALCRKFLLQARSYRAMFPDKAREGQPTGKSKSVDNLQGKGISNGHHHRSASGILVS
ncbi:von Willebrand factor A domain-containing protein 3A [Exaiptasia diaphana]|uniref:VWFA domain-containing protein n=1 Tax=Exaiptasia diaphana TaxID=2652724 RepID=A0A913X825_EXADI|nr:von Willebrand factor A domain-containing protein 3A [Exaiptasia diaphana]KXJ28494.1 von Willebrand factor A domain-containing protein 3A [Exaiptasia diaphana]